MFAKYDSVDEVQNNEMGGASGTYGREETCLEGLGEKT